MKGIYLAAYKDFLPDYDIDYCDIVKSSEHINILADMLTVDLSGYDYCIATPPCNYYSKCNYRRDSSRYALSTRHLLPCIITKLAVSFSDKPFIIENVRNSRVFELMHIFDLVNIFNLNLYEIGRHTYITNIFIDFHNIPQVYDFRSVTCSNGFKRCYRISSNCQGGQNVNAIFKFFIESIGG